MPSYTASAGTPPFGVPATASPAVSVEAPVPASAAAPPTSAFRAPPEELVLASGLALLGVRELPTPNRGELVDLMNLQAAAPMGSPWCASYVRRAGHYGLLDPCSGQSHWPLPTTASCETLGEYAQAHAVLDVIPMRGDVFLLWSPHLQRFHHTGFILDTIEETPTGYQCRTLEGNTNTDGSVDGVEVALRTRAFTHDGQDRFIDWVTLLSGKG